MQDTRYILLLVLSAMLAVMLAGCGEAPLDIDEQPAEGQETDITPSVVHRSSHYTYLFSFSVRDSAGNDLLAPLGEEYYKSDSRYPPYGEIDPAKLIITLKRPAGGYSPAYAVKCDEQHNPLPQNEDLNYEGTGIWYLSNQLQIFGESVQDSMILSLQCHNIFGDYRFHDLAVFWEEEPHQYAIPPYEQYPICIKATLEGQEVIAEKFVRHLYENTEYARDIVFYFLDFILDK